MKHLHKADIIAIVILFSIGLVISFLIYMPSKKNGTFVEVRIDGVTTQRYSLSENRSETIQTPNGTNTFYINAGSVHMNHADCQDQICVNTKKISQNGQSIVCLPHKLVLTIVSNTAEEPDYDAVTGGAP